MPKYKTHTNDLTEVIEAGGGGGKLYLHQFTLPIYYSFVCENVIFNYYSTDDKPITWSYINSKGWTWLSKLSYTIPLISNASALVGFPCGLAFFLTGEPGNFVIKANLYVMLLDSMGTITTKEFTLNNNSYINDNVTLVQ